MGRSVPKMYGRVSNNISREMIAEEVANRCGPLRKCSVTRTPAVVHLEGQLGALANIQRVPVLFLKGDLIACTAFF